MLRGKPAQTCFCGLISLDAICIPSPPLPTLAPPTEIPTLASSRSRTLQQELRSKPLTVKDVVYKEHNLTVESCSFTNTSTKEKNPWTKHSYGLKDHSWQHNRKTASTEQLRKLGEYSQLKHRSAPCKLEEQSSTGT